MSPVLLAHRAGAASPGTEALLSLDDDRVRVVSVLAAEDAGAVQVRLQSFADADVELTLTTGFPVASARSTTYLGDDLAALPVQQGTVRLTVPRLGVAAVTLELT